MTDAGVAGRLAVLVASIHSLQRQMEQLEEAGVSLCSIQVTDYDPPRVHVFNTTPAMLAQLSGGAEVREESFQRVSATADGIYWFTFTESLLAREPERQGTPTADTVGAQ